MPVFGVNTDEVIKLVDKLETLKKSAFPSAIRNTLNTAAFEMKKEVPVQASGKFVTRSKAFFKRFTTVQKADGWNIDRMKSTTGINSLIDSRVAKNLSSQEFGGLIKTDKLIPHNEARISSSFNKRVSKKNRLNNVSAHNATKAFKNHRGTKKSKFIAAVMSTKKSGSQNMLLKTGKTGLIYQLKSVRKTSSGVRFKAKKLYLVRSENRYNVRGVDFLRDSGNKVSKRIPRIFEKQANYQIKKHWK